MMISGWSRISVPFSVSTPTTTFSLTCTYGNSRVVEKVIVILKLCASHLESLGNSVLHLEGHVLDKGHVEAVLARVLKRVF